MLSFGKPSPEQNSPPHAPRSRGETPTTGHGVAAADQLASLETPTNILSTAEKVIPTLLRESSQFCPEGAQYGRTDPPTYLSKLSLLYSIGAEHLLVVRDPLIDPVLCRWLDKHVARARECPTELQRVESLMKSARSTFSRSPNRFLHPIATARYEAMTNKNDEIPRLMGEFINNRMGDCRHIAMLLQLGFQEIGVPSAMLIGDLEQRVGPSPGQPLFRAFHALNMVVADQKYRLIDPAHRINQQLGWAGHNPVTPGHIVERFMGHGMTTDPTTSWLGETTRFYFKVVDTSLAGLPQLSDSHTESFLKGVIRANLT